MIASLEYLVCGKSDMSIIRILHTVINLLKEDVDGLCGVRNQGSDRTSEILNLRCLQYVDTRFELKGYQ